MLRLLVSILAPVSSSMQLVPQLYKAYQTKSVYDLSFSSLLLFLVSAFLWLLHGLFISDISLVLSGAFTVLVSMLLLFFFFLYQSN
jgi:uncharacterized protein with PQ loop repeat